MNLFRKILTLFGLSKGRTGIMTSKMKFNFQKNN